jgi:hypothetical protein
MFDYEESKDNDSTTGSDESVQSQVRTRLGEQSIGLVVLASADVADSTTLLRVLQHCQRLGLEQEQLMLVEYGASHGDEQVQDMLEEKDLHAVHYVASPFNATVACQVALAEATDTFAYDKVLLMHYDRPEIVVAAAKSLPPQSDQVKEHFGKACLTGLGCIRRNARRPPVEIL